LTTAALEWLDGLQGSGIRPGLSRMRALLRVLGRPQHSAPSIIIAGTNGKGSTSAMLTSILRSAGYRTGFYTSPHLVDIRERWQIDGQLISSELLEESVTAIRDAAERSGILPTYFEAMTLIAFVAFSRARCELYVLEVGMGGRLDATNVVKPLAALITPIGLDHTEFLGRTLRKVGREKAGVIHRGTIVLTSNDEPASLEVIRDRAEMFGNRFIHVTEEHETPLAGGFQRRNAGLAVRAARELRHLFPRIDEAAIAHGVATTRWRGRLERIELEGKTIWIDGGHNLHAVEHTAPWFDANVPHPRLLVFGMMSDKDVQPVVDELFPLFDSVIATEPYPPRSVPASTFAGATPIPDPREALRAALEAPERFVVVTGSLYLAGAAVEFFDKIAAS
jgi:dihydrofolate synthase / folylpolyglutamate synthase